MRHLVDRVWWAAVVVVLFVACGGVVEPVAGTGGSWSVIAFTSHRGDWWGVYTVTPDGLIERKLTHFASNKRAIIDIQVTSTPTGPHLAVASTLDRE